MVRIEFKDLIIDEVEGSSGIFSGRNIQVGWKAVIKTNSGFGNLEGDRNCSNSNKSIVVEDSKLREEE